jgi:hypothetical protein
MSRLSTEQKFLIGAGALTVGGIAFFAWRRSAKAAPAKCLTAPYAITESELTKLVRVELDAGRREPSSIAIDVATKALSPHPSGPAVVFPPIRNAEINLPLPGVECAWELVKQSVTATMKARGIEAGEDAPPNIKPSRAPREFEPEDESPDTYPWERPLVSRSNWPTINSFFIVGRPTDTGDGEWNIDSEAELVRAALDSALEFAGNPKPEWVILPAQGTPEWSDPAGYWGIDAKRLRRQMAQLIRCSPWNDQLYGQTDPYKAGGSATVTYMMEPSGRGLNWMPVHSNNINLLSQDKQPKRNTNMQGDPVGPATSHMQLWIPAVNLDFLAPSLADSALNVTTQGMAWSDGSSTIQPPPTIAEVGVDTGVTGVLWGCA